MIFHHKSIQMAKKSKILNLTNVDKDVGQQTPLLSTADGKVKQDSHYDRKFDNFSQTKQYHMMPCLCSD